MKSLIVLVVGLLSLGCGKMDERLEQPVNADENISTKAKTRKLSAEEKKVVVGVPIIDIPEEEQSTYKKVK